jgi:hypothetical protein
MKRGTAEMLVTVEAEGTFPVKNSLAVLRIGDQEFKHSKHVDGDNKRLQFLVPSTMISRLRFNAEAVVHYGDATVISLGVWKGNG